MPYSNAWSVATPTDSNPANAIASYDRQTRLNVQERINSIIGVAIGAAFADPVIGPTLTLAQLRLDIDSMLATVLNQELDIHGAAGRFYPTTYVRPAAVQNQLAIVQASHGAGNTVLFDLSPIPVGATLVDVSIYWLAPATSTLTPILYRQSHAGSFIMASPGSIAGTGAQVTTTFATAILLVVDSAYVVTCDCILGVGDTLNLIAAKIRYTTPSANVRR